LGARRLSPATDPRRSIRRPGAQPRHRDPLLPGAGRLRRRLPRPRLGFAPAEITSTHRFWRAGGVSPLMTSSGGSRPPLAVSFPLDLLGQSDRKTEIQSQQGLLPRRRSVFHGLTSPARLSP